MNRHSSRKSVLLIGYTALFLAAAWLAWFAAHRVAATPEPEWDAIQRMNELVASRQTAGANAWPIYERIIRDELGFEDLGRTGGNELYAELRQFLTLNAPGLGDWDDPIWREQRERLEGLHRLVSLLDELGAAPGYARPYVPPPDMQGDLTPAFAVLLPEAGHIRSLARLNVVGLRAAAESEDWDELVRRFRAGQAMARHLTFQATLIEWLVATSMAHLIQEELRHILMERDLPAHVCDRLLDALESLAWPATPIAGMLDGERITLEDFVQWTYTTGDNGFLVHWAVQDILGGGPGTIGVPDDRRVDPGLFWRLSNLNPATLIAPNRARTMRAIDGMFTAIQSRAAADAEERTIDQALVLSRIDGVYMLEMLTPAFDRAFNNVRSAMTMQAGLEIMLRIELHHAQTGAWPGTLAEAMTQAQTIDPVTGDPIEYELVEDDEHGRPYILRAPDEYTHFVRIPHWPELNPVRPPIPDAMREAWEAEREERGEGGG